MTAIEVNGQTYKVEQQRGAFTQYINGKGKFTCIETAKGTIVEVCSISPIKEKTKTKKLNRANFMNAAEIEQYLNSEVANMSDCDFAEYREKKAYNSISW